MSETETEAPTPKAAAGWYPDPKAPGTPRFWNGTSWTDQKYAKRWKPAPLKSVDRPGGLILGALLLAFGGGAISFPIYLISRDVGTIVAIVVLSFCSILFQIGIIAKGVELGIRAARHRPDLDF